MNENDETPIASAAVRLAAEQLAPRTPAELAAAVIAGVAGPAPEPVLVGHERASRAIEYSLSVDLPGYNLFVMGPKGIGKSQFVRQAIARRARASSSRDWVYVHQFGSADQPLAFGLPSGDGARLRARMRELVRELRATLPAAFEAESYATEIERVQSALAEQQNTALQAIHDEASASGIALLQTPNGLSFAPVQEGEVMPPETFNALPTGEQETIRKRIRELEEKLQRAMRETMRYRREQVADIQRINRETARFATEQAIEELRAAFDAATGLHPWFDALQADLLEHYELFLPQKASAEQGPFVAQPDFGRYEVNLLTESCNGQAPVVVVDHPTMPELVGRIEYRANFGTLNTDFRLIKPGKLHLANGGYLLVDAWRLLAEPFAWDALKRTLQRGAIRIESPAEASGMTGTARLEPAPIPISVKVVVFGERYLYHLLSEHDPEFCALFRVVADFDDALPRDDAHQRGLAQVVLAQARQANLAPFQPAGLARLLDEAARLSDDNQRLSAHVQSLIEIAVEADHEARRDGAGEIGLEHVRRAVTCGRDRMARSYREYQRAIERGVLLIDTHEQRIGQVNGLAVYDIGGHGFGHPSRITATTRFGEGNLLDIQRETQLGGSIHTKGVMILSAYLASRFAARQPMPVNATLNFEQSYGPVDGDSATIAETCALLSSLSRSPLRQDLAVTGSMNQLGEVQAVGGVNHKIEGFYEVCRARGLSGTQGVVMPASNIEHLMLDEEVVDAVRAGRFHIYAVDHVDQALELMLGLPIGGPTDAAHADTLTGRVQARLADLLVNRAGDRALARRARLTSGERGG
ncbi:MAG: ATP-binding protein [Burkholderiaceae bacterium]